MHLRLLLVLLLPLTTACSGNTKKVPTATYPMEPQDNEEMETEGRNTTRSQYYVLLDRRYKNPTLVQIVRELGGNELMEQIIAPDNSDSHKFLLYLPPNMEHIAFTVQVDGPGGRVYVGNMDSIHVLDGTLPTEEETMREINEARSGFFRGAGKWLFIIKESEIIRTASF